MSNQDSQSSINRIEQARLDFLLAQTRKDMAEDHLTKLQASYDEKMALAEDIAAGRKPSGGLDKAMKLGAEIDELKKQFNDTEKEISANRSMMDAAVATFEELEGTRTLDGLPEM